MGLNHKLITTMRFAIQSAAFRALGEAERREEIYAELAALNQLEVYLLEQQAALEVGCWVWNFGI